MRRRASCSSATKRFTQLSMPRKIVVVDAEGARHLLEQALLLDLERPVRIGEVQQVQDGDDARAPRIEDVADAVELQVVGDHLRLHRHLALEFVQHVLLVGVEKAVGHDDVVRQAQQRIPLFGAERRKPHGWRLPRYGKSSVRKLATMMTTASQPTPRNSLTTSPCSKKSSMRCHTVPFSRRQRPPTDHGEHKESVAHAVANPLRYAPPARGRAGGCACGRAACARCRRARCDAHEFGQTLSRGL